MANIFDNKPQSKPQQPNQPQAPKPNTPQPQRPQSPQPQAPKVEPKRDLNCPGCKGLGLTGTPPSTLCPQCQGTGKV